MTRAFVVDRASRMMPLRDSWTFLRQFVTAPRAVGAISPSSLPLANRMVEWIDWAQVRAVAEYGPGTGIFTERVLAHLPTGAKFFAIEANPRFVAMLRDRFPSVRIHQDSVENIEELCRQEEIASLDAIVCGLPWAAFSESNQTRCLDATRNVLRAGGQFVTFAYLQGLLLPAGQRFRRKLDRYFREVQYSRTVWRNLPPAFVYRYRL